MLLLAHKFQSKFDFQFYLFLLHYEKGSSFTGFELHQIEQRQQHSTLRKVRAAFTHTYYVLLHCDPNADTTGLFMKQAKCHSFFQTSEYENRGPLVMLSSNQHRRSCLRSIFTSCAAAWSTKGLTSCSSWCYWDVYHFNHLNNLTIFLNLS